MKIFLLFLILQVSCSLTAEKTKTPKKSIKKTSWEQDFHEYTHKLPKDVVTLLGRMDTCNHFAGEEAYNEERRNEIQNAFEKYDCKSIDKNKNEILLKYKKSLRITKKINGFIDWKWSDNKK